MAQLKELIPNTWAHGSDSLHTHSYPWTYNAINSLSFPYPLVDFEISSIASPYNTSEFNLNHQVLSETDFAAINVKRRMCTLTNGKENLCKKMEYQRINKDVMCSQPPFYCHVLLDGRPNPKKKLIVSWMAWQISQTLNAVSTFNLKICIQSLWYLPFQWTSKIQTLANRLFPLVKLATMKHVMTIQKRMWCSFYKNCPSTDPKLSDTRACPHPSTAVKVHANRTYRSKVLVRQSYQLKKKSILTCETALFSLYNPIKTATQTSHFIDKLLFSFY